MVKTTTWHGTQAWQADWSPGSRVVAWMLRRYGGNHPEDIVYVALNSFWDSLRFELPRPHGERRWHVAINTAMPSPHDAWELGQEPPVDDQTGILLAGRSAIVLIALNSVIQSPWPARFARLIVPRSLCFSVSGALCACRSPAEVPRGTPPADRVGVYR